MGRLRNVIYWLLGLIVLLFLLRFPYENVVTLPASYTLPLTGMTIVLDPGHGGIDGGAVGSDETVEKDIVLAISEYVRDYLEQAGAIVYLTRTTDEDLVKEDIKRISERKSLDIRKRLSFVESKEADIFLSIHANALPSKRWSGAQTFYYPRLPDNKLLAEKIQEEIIRNLENTTRQPLEIKHVYLLKHVTIPSALVEVGFLSNDAELELLKNRHYQKQLALTIYQGIIRYIEEVDANGDGIIE